MSEIQKRITELGSCFHSETVNCGRQKELDMVKGFAIIFMVWDHVSRELGGNVESPFGMFVDMILAGPFAAPMFMICMGIGICYSRKQDWKSLIKRGVGILLLGYVLNVFRYIIPQMILFAMTGNSSYMSGWIFKLCEVDILQFAGLSFLAIGLAKKWNLSKWVLLAVASGLSVMGCLLKGIHTGLTLPDLILGLFWKTETHAYFTFFHWFIFPVAGMILGDFLMRCKDKMLMYKKIIPVILPIGVIAELSALAMGIGLIGDFTEYYYMTLLDVMFLICLAIEWAGVLYYIYPKFPAFMVRTFQKMSKNINQIYCIHWGIIGLLGIVRVFTWKDTIISMLPMTILSFVILFISSIVAEYYQNWKKERKSYGNQIIR